MPTGKSCFVCKHTKAVDPKIHMHRFPKEVIRRQQWLEALGIEEGDLPKDARGPRRKRLMHMSILQAHADALKL